MAKNIVRINNEASNVLEKYCAKTGAAKSKVVSKLILKLKIKDI